MLRIFEYDDYPVGSELFVRWCHFWRKQYPGLRINVFAIPQLMKRRHWRRLESLGDCVRVYPHGWDHIKFEARRERFLKQGGACDQLLRMMDGDKRWRRVFKGAHYGCSQPVAERLGREWIAVALKSYQGWSMPAPNNVRVFIRWDYNVAQNWQPGRSVLLHPEDLKKRSRLYEFMQDWSARDTWGFVDDFLEPAQRKLHLGCGPHVFQGWRNFDNRADKLRNGAEHWEFPNAIPLHENTVECCAQGHLLNYVAEEDWLKLFLDVWRVLKPGGVYRLSEDTSDGYVWRPIGRHHSTGTILSNPTKASVFAALKRVGFSVVQVDAGYTQSPHVDVLQLASRRSRYAKGHKFYAEATKSIEIRDLSRVWREDDRAMKAGPYVLPGHTAQERYRMYAERLVESRRVSRRQLRRQLRRHGAPSDPLAESNDGE